jgi:hypothetical protein
MVVGLARRIDAHGIQTNEDGLRRAGSAKFNPSNFDCQHQQHPQTGEGNTHNAKGFVFVFGLVFASYSSWYLFLLCAARSRCSIMTRPWYLKTRPHIEAGLHIARTFVIQFTAES